MRARDPRAQRRLSAGARGDRGLLPRQARGAGRGGGPARIHRAGDRRHAAPRSASTRRLPARTCCRTAGEYTVEVIARGLAALPCAACAGDRARRRQRVARGDGQAARRRGRGAGPAAAGAAAAVLHRLPGAAGVRGAEARAAGHRPLAHCRRHRLPRVRDVRAVLDGPLDPRLRHEPREPRGRVADDEAPHAGGDGRRRLLAQRTADRRAVGALQRRRRGAAHHEERLHVGDRHAGDHFHARRGREDARRRQGAVARARQPGDREHAARHRRRVAAHGRQLRRGEDARDARRGVHDARSRGSR